MSNPYLDPLPHSNLGMRVTSDDGSEAQGAEMSARRSNLRRPADPDAISPAISDGVETGKARRSLGAMDEEQEQDEVGDEREEAGRDVEELGAARKRVEQQDVERPRSSEQGSEEVSSGVEVPRRNGRSSARRYASLEDETRRASAATRMHASSARRYAILE